MSGKCETLSDKDALLMYEESCKAIPDKSVLYQNVMKLERAHSLFYTDVSIAGPKLYYVLSSTVGPWPVP